jgi:hypothetical protein
MTLRDIDATVRENSMEMFGNVKLPSLYVTSLNMLAAHAQASSPGFSRWKPVDVKVTAKERVEPL